MARKTKKQKEAEKLAELERFVEADNQDNQDNQDNSSTPEVVDVEEPKAERSARATPVAKTETAETKAYPTDPVSNPGFDDGTTLRDGTLVNAVPTGDGTTVDATLTYGVDVALANTEAITDVEKATLADTMGRVAALHDEQSFDPYERQHAV